MIEPRYLGHHPSTTIYLGHLDELHYLSTGAVQCGSDALEHQHSTYLRSTEQDVFLNNHRTAVQRDNTSESLKCKLTSCEKNKYRMSERI